MLKYFILYMCVCVNIYKKLGKKRVWFEFENARNEQKIHDDFIWFYFRAAGTGEDWVCECEFMCVCVWSLETFIVCREMCVCVGHNWECWALELSLSHRSRSTSRGWLNVTYAVCMELTYPAIQYFSGSQQCQSMLLLFVLLLLFSSLFCYLL